jgi:hypothetical protein
VLDPTRYQSDPTPFLLSSKLGPYCPSWRGPAPAEFGPTWPNHCATSSRQSYTSSRRFFLHHLPAFENRTKDYVRWIFSTKTLRQPLPSLLHSRCRWLRVDAPRASLARRPCGLTACPYAPTRSITVPASPARRCRPYGDLDFDKC